MSALLLTQPRRHAKRAITMAQITALSPALFSVLLDQVAQGKVRPANLVGNVFANVKMTHNNKTASFVKEAPGRYTVHLGDAQEPASSPVEAKLLIIDYLAKP